MFLREHVTVTVIFYSSVKQSKLSSNYQLSYLPCTYLLLLLVVAVEAVLVVV